MASRSPLVSVITPVYNGENYLAQCIESVLSQTYDHWEYTIINNASTDGTLQIAESYAAKEPRVKVSSNPRCVDVIESHNIAFRHIAVDSVYTKVVSADDWLYPDCIATLVSLAERNPSVGIVQGYVSNVNGIRWPGIASERSVVSGRAACREHLLGKLEFAGIPSSLLYRSSLVRATDPFFPGSNPNADAAACLRCLQGWDLGVVHQVLSYERIHDEAVSSAVRELGRQIPDQLELLQDFGPRLLTDEEFAARRDALVCEYYRWLANGIIHLRPWGFWTYHIKDWRSLVFLGMLPSWEALYSGRCWGASVASRCDAGQDLAADRVKRVLSNWSQVWRLWGGD